MVRCTGGFPCAAVLQKTRLCRHDSRIPTAFQCFYFGMVGRSAIAISIMCFQPHFLPPATQFFFFQWRHFTSRLSPPVMFNLQFFTPSSGRRPPLCRAIYDRTTGSCTPFLEKNFAFRSLQRLLVFRLSPELRGAHTTLSAALAAIGPVPAASPGPTPGPVSSSVSAQWTVSSSEGLPVSSTSGSVST